MTSEAQKRAVAKYRAKNRKNLLIGFYGEKEEALYNWCKEKGASEIKRILTEVMNKGS